MKQFTVMECEVQGALISRLYKPGTMIKYLCDDELYDEIHDIHIGKGHGGRDILKAAINENKCKYNRKLLLLIVFAVNLVVINMIKSKR